jgi:hypothetical protein
MEWLGALIGIIVGIGALSRLHPVATVGLGAVALVGFLLSLAYVLSHYDECGSCDQTAGAHLAGGITFFFMALAPIAILLGSVKFVWRLFTQRTE